MGTDLVLSGFWEETPQSCGTWLGLDGSCYMMCYFCAAEDAMDGKVKVKVQKRHQQKHSGPKAERKKLRKQGASTEEDERRRNPKAYAVQSAVRMAKTFHRSDMMAE